MKNVLFRSFLVFVIFATGSVFGYFYLSKKPPLPIISPKDINPELVDSTMRATGKEHIIGDFHLTNQLGEIITAENYKGKIYIANFIFTTCPKMCPLMTANMNTVYKEFKDDKEVAFISHSVTPEIDSVPMLLAFAKKHDAHAPQWNFVTGDKKEIYKLARKHYFAATTNGDGGINDFIHTENFVLIDKQKRIRGIYDGTSFDEVDQLIIDISTLKKEEQ